MSRRLLACASTKCWTSCTNSMRRIWDGLAGGLLVLWIGGMWAIGYVAAPVLFANLGDKQLAGMLAGRLFAERPKAFRRRLDPTVQHRGADAAFADQPVHQQQHRAAQLVRDPVAVELVTVGERRRQFGDQRPVTVAALARCRRGRRQSFGIARGMRRLDGIDEAARLGIGVERVPTLRRLVAAAIGGAEMLGA